MNVDIGFEFIELALRALAAIIAMVAHELPKHYVSLALLHPLHRKRDDLKVNVLRFVDPIGMIFFMFSGIGWQKPGEYIPTRYKDKERGLLYVVLAGMAGSFLLIGISLPFIWANPFLTYDIHGVAVRFFFFLLQCSFSIIILNLIPIPPLDMTKIIHQFNPSYYYKMMQNQRSLHSVFLLLIIFGILQMVINTLFMPVLVMLGVA